ncbi:pectinesterase family protein [Clostridium sp. SHJSY1]|uniref:pectinesterase family protein n=1 Tax=Clostridium sp. SHJSY1 TaxID=2942483 RepID=UPI00287484A0|nr:pectinesterase family protein [Clostridium sp. SHJSY1]MDS0524762.1 pectinesterase family protein [Clostridium sp. SHJSY1]
MKKKFLSMLIATTIIVSQGLLNPIVTKAEELNITNYENVVNNENVNMVVDANYSGNDGEILNNIKTFKTVQAAINTVPDNNSNEIIIFIKNGTYKEKMIISKPNITLIGEDSKKTILTYDVANGTVKLPEHGGNGVATYGTTGSASITLTTTATGFSAANLTIENSFNEEAHSNIKNQQAVAIKNEADKSTFVNCRFIGNQDTLYANKNKQYYYKCFIQGDVDFIFGAASAVFDNCEINSINREGINNPKGYVAAPSTLAENSYGYLFLNSKLTSDISEEGSVYLGRPWHPGGVTQSVKSNVVFKNCEMGRHISKVGWSEMSGQLPENNFMYEYGSTGEGAKTSDTRKVLSEEQAGKFTKENVLQGWDTTSKVNELTAFNNTIPKDDNSNNNNSNSSTNEAEQVKWNFTRFGATTSEANNTVSVDDKNKTVTLTSGKKDGTSPGGKIAGSNDGISYYYTELDNTKNFELSANVKVNYFEKEKPDNQCGFGIMARDILGVANDSSVSPSNMALVGGYQGKMMSVFRNGVTSDLSGKITMENPHVFNSKRPANDGTATYKLKLKKTNTGYIASIDNGEEVTYYRPKQLEVIDNKVYVGFFTARIASITVSDINLTTSNVATDPAGVPEPEQKIDPSIKVLSSSDTGSSKYKLSLKNTVEGNVNVKLNGEQVYDAKAQKNSEFSIDTNLKLGTNKFEITYTPDKTSANSNISPITVPCNVIYKSYGTENGDVYVSQNGTSDGSGTIDNPIDIYSALKYTNNGQSIKVKGGTYNLKKPLTISKDNKGTEDRLKALTTYDGERAIFDFGKISAGLTIAGSYWHVYGVDVCNTSDKEHGITVSGNNNKVEAVKTYKNGDTGLQVSGAVDDSKDKWPKNNLILNCESYDNMDGAMNNADGFAAKISTGSGNVFRGCISHNNCDDGWDLFSKLESGAIDPVTIEDCVAYGNGTLTDGTVTKGDGNGFKLGGEGIPVKHILKNSLSFGNNAAGITSNSNPAIIVQNSVSVDNDVNYSLDYYTGANLQFNFENNISFRTKPGKADVIVDMVKGESNYFYNGTDTENSKGKKIEASDFVSTEMPNSIVRDSNYNIDRKGYMVLVGKTPSPEPSPSPSPKSTLGESTENDSDSNTSTTAKTGDIGFLGVLGLGVVSLAGSISSRKKKK